MTVKRAMFVCGALASIISMIWWLSWSLANSHPFKWWGFPLGMSGVVVFSAITALCFVKAVDTK